MNPIPPVVSRALRLGVVAAALLPPGPAAAVPARCDAAQRALFTCSAGRKTISVCGSRDLAPSAGRIEYRFGRARAAELRYPPAHVEWRRVTRGGTLTFSGGGGAFLAFTRAPYRYIVYTASGRGWGPRSGLVVEKKGRRIAGLRCTGALTSELGPALFEAAGIEVADDAFELPR